VRGEGFPLMRRLWGDEPGYSSGADFAMARLASGVGQAEPCSARLSVPRPVRRGRVHVVAMS
jgi:hypothetical protein